MPVSDVRTRKGARSASGSLGPAVGLPDLEHHLLDLVLDVPEDADRSTLARQPQSGRAPDAGTPAGDQSELAFERPAFLPTICCRDWQVARDGELSERSTHGGLANRLSPTPVARHGPVRVMRLERNRRATFG
jgi:hypothetical protein